MANPLSPKRLHIEKANATMAVAVAVAAFVTVFSLFACRALLQKRSYLNHVITEKTKARDQLIKNNEEVAKLATAYQVFVSSPDNIIKGSSAGNGEKDGDNAQIILDALPSKYDFPALISSLEKLIGGKGHVIESVTGIDDEVNQTTVATSGLSQPVAMPFDISVKGDFKGLEDVLRLMERSIRPFEVLKLVITGDSKELRTAISAQSYYQPGKTLSITTKVVE